MPVSRKRRPTKRPVRKQTAVTQAVIRQASPYSAAGRTPLPESKQLTRNQVVTELTRSPHGNLSEYCPVGVRAVAEDPTFMAHLIAWNEKNGQVRDSRVALPVLTLSEKQYPVELVENSLAHLALLDPRLLEQAYRFALTIRVTGRSRALDRVVEQYLRVREKEWGWWTRTALQHRRSMRSLYSLAHVRPAPAAQRVLFDRDYPKGSVFDQLRTLREKNETEIAATIIKHRLPFLTLASALGPKLKNPDVVLALIKAMSPTELVTSTKMLERMGMKESPILRAAFEEGLAKLADSKKNTLKTTRAAEQQTDAKLKAKLVAAQEKQLKALSIDGNWLVLGDKSGSMSQAIDAACLVAGTLAKLVKGEVHLVFFDVAPTYFPVTGLDYEAIKRKVGRIYANGGTSIGCGLMSIMERGIDVDGIAIVSDGGENTSPRFGDVYTAYSKKLDKAVPVYWYMLGAIDESWAEAMNLRGHDVQKFNLHGVDMYSLPNLAQTMRPSRYSLGDEIMSTSLKTLEEAFAWRP